MKGKPAFGAFYYLPVPEADSERPDNYCPLELKQYLGKGAGEQLQLELQTTDHRALQVSITYPEPEQGRDVDPITIDPGSGSWRMVWIVTEVELNDGTHWKYDGSLG